MGELRASARKPAQLPPVMRMADGYGLRGETELGAGDPIAAARAFERGREAWAAIVARQVVARDHGGAAGAGSGAGPGGAVAHRHARAGAPRTGTRTRNRRRVTCRSRR